MAKVDFVFKGLVVGARVKEAVNVAEGKVVDVSRMSNEELAKKLNDGELRINLVDFLNVQRAKSVVEMTYRPCEDGARVDSAATTESEGRVAKNSAHPTYEKAA